MIVPNNPYGLRQPHFEAAAKKVLVRYAMLTHLVTSQRSSSCTDRSHREYAKNCILARRLIEKGVRVVQLFNGSDPSGGNGITDWDSHSAILKTHAMQAEIMDQPTAALIADLKQRGLLEHTLVVWATEFGRMPSPASWPAPA